DDRRPSASAARAAVAASGHSSAGRAGPAESAARVTRGAATVHQAQRRRDVGGHVKPLLIASVKGGVGTSMVSALVALTAVDGGDNVLLVDCREAGGTLHHLLGVRPTHRLGM